MDSTAIRSRINQRNLQVVKMQSVPPQKKVNLAVIFLSTCIVCLSLATFWAVLTDGGKAPLLSQKKEPVVTAVKSESPTKEQAKAFFDFLKKPEPQVDPDKKKFEAWMDQTDKKLSAIDEQYSTLNHRMWLFTVAHNENVNLTRRLQVTQGIADPGYIVFDSEWKLNKKPITMKMTQEQLDSAAK